MRSLFWTHWATPLQGNWRTQDGRKGAQESQESRAAQSLVEHEWQYSLNPVFTKIEFLRALGLECKPNSQDRKATNTHVHGKARSPPWKFCERTFYQMPNGGWDAQDSTWVACWEGNKNYNYDLEKRSTNPDPAIVLPMMIAIHFSAAWKVRNSLYVIGTPNLHVQKFLSKRHRIYFFFQLECTCIFRITYLFINNAEVGLLITYWDRSGTRSTRPMTSAGKFYSQFLILPQVEIPNQHFKDLLYLS